MHTNNFPSRPIPTLYILYYVTCDAYHVVMMTFWSIMDVSEFILWYVPAVCIPGAHSLT